MKKEEKKRVQGHGQFSQAVENGSRAQYFYSESEHLVSATCMPNWLLTCPNSSVKYWSNISFVKI
jgi:hypothetical protein